MKKIIIIWAWAAGLMTAATILENTEWDFHIHLFEKNASPGKKVIISWWGRCNVTTGITDKKDLLSRYTRGADFIKKAMGKFSPKKCYEWFESHGVPLKTQEDMRVFPVSDDGRDIVNVFESVFRKYWEKISLHYMEWVSEIRRWENEYFLVTTPRWIYEGDVLVITTWGNAYSHTGSTGDGYAFARSLGHKITPLWPSLSSFLTSDTWLHELSWLSFEKARIKSDSLELSWPILLTHFGISWPLTFKLSSHFAFERIEKNHTKTIHLSPLVDMNFLVWEEFLKSSFSSHPKKFIINILSEKLSRRFVESFIGHYFPHIRETFVASISRLDRERISKLLWDWLPIILLERRPGDEFVTAGWIDTIEVENETMESKIQKNLYFAGEVLDVDGYTGGFSLQICWASGHTAGKDIAIKML